MVWGMRLPNDFGQFWPSGEFEYDPQTSDSGWYDRLRDYYYAQTPEEQIRLYDYRKLEEGDNTVEGGANQYRTHVPSKFRIEVGKKDPMMHHLAVAPVEPHEVPLSFDADKSYASLGSLIKLNDRIVAVDEALKMEIERLEPGVHQFFPIQIGMPGAKRPPSDYYILVVSQYFDSYQAEKSDPGKRNFSGLVFSRDAFGAAHLWKDRGTPALIYLSDELKVGIDNACLNVPQLYKMKEV